MQNSFVQAEKLYIILMTRFRFILPVLACASLMLLGACGDLDLQPTDSNSQKCSTTPQITGFLADFGGYKKGKSIPFKHSDGYLFSLMVTDRQNYIDDYCQKHLNTSLESPYPIYSILLSSQTNTFYYDEKDKQNSGIIDVDFGQYRFSLRNPVSLQNSLVTTKVHGKDTMFYGIDSMYIDTIRINDVLYTEVAVSHGGKLKRTSKTDFQNSNTIASDAKLYYNTKKGILKIEMEDGSHISINEKGGK